MYESNVKELNQQIAEQYLERYKKKKGRNQVYIGKYNDDFILTVDGEMEIIRKLDIRIKVSEKKYVADDTENVVFLMQDPAHFMVCIRGKLFTCGKKFDCPMDSVLVYVQTMNMCFLFYYDVMRKVYPICECVYDRELLACEVPQKLQSKYELLEYDKVTNLYHIITNKAVEEVLDEER